MATQTDTFFHVTIASETLCGAASPMSRTVQIGGIRACARICDACAGLLDTPETEQRIEEAYRLYNNRESKR